MAWFTDRHFFLLAVAVYGLSTVYSVFLWRKGFRKDDHVNYFLLLAAFALHTAGDGSSAAFPSTIAPSTIFTKPPRSSRGALVAAYLVIGLLPRLRFLGAFASPVLFAIGVFALMPRSTRRTARSRNFPAR